MNSMTAFVIYNIRIMKKKIVSLVLLGMYFFGGMGIVLADTGTTDSSSDQSQAETNRLNSQESAAAPSSSPAPSGGPSDMTSTKFTLNPNDLSPSQNSYNRWTETNLKTILAGIGKTLLIATTGIAVLSIVVGGILISTTGPSDRAAKGKTIIMLNIMAILIALFSYSIIRLVSWLIA